jgi:peptidoglycan/xylan/chitin deacetylase (PgdA/CDA1 family)
LATFFIIGAHAEKHPHLLEQVARAGHTIGSHGFSHQPLPTMASKKMADDVRRSAESLTAITGQSPQLFRPPYGLLDARGAHYLKDNGMQPVYWSLVTEDWLPIGAKRVVARVQRRLHNDALIVLHEKWFPRQTLQATKEVLQLGKAAGYRFSALS